MAGTNEKIRFWLPAVVLLLAAIGVGTRLVMLHLSLVTARTKQPDYGFTRNSQGCRGAIYCMDGNEVLAQTKTVWDYHIDAQAATLDPANPKKPISAKARREKMQTISDVLQIPLLKVMDAYAARDPKNPSKMARYVKLATSDDDGVHEVLSNPKLRLNELSITERQVRVYPQGRRLSHIVGFVSRDPTNRVGVAGIELRYEGLLKGTPGTVRGTRLATGGEARGRREIDVDARSGNDVYLTIDPNIQYEVERALAAGVASNKAERAWAIVLSVKTGAVLAMANLPDYDPNEYNKSADSARFNGAISENYEPGSVMKTITACAVLNERLVGPDTMISTARNDPNYFRLPGDGSHKWEDRMSVRDALVHSSNIVYGKLGFDLGPKRLWSYMRAFGLGQRTGIELPGEETGIIPNWNTWDKVKWSRAPIGQGVAVTAIQLASAYAAIGNDGELLRPYLVQKVVDPDGTVLYENKGHEVLGNPIRPETARKVREMMLGVAKKGGTARRAAVMGYSVAGKTGTAQMREGRGYSQTAYNASFIGIVPASRPEIVILVTYQKPAYCRSFKLSQETGLPLYNHQGGVCAAPTFSRIASNVLRYLAVEPDIPEEIDPDLYEDVQEEGNSLP